MNLSEQLEAARQKLDSTDNNQRSLYASGAAIKEHHRQLQKTAVFRLQINILADPLNLSNTTGGVLGEMQGEVFTNLAKVAALITALDASEDYAGAERAIAPIVTEIHNLEAEIAAETHARLTAEGERQDRIDAAKAAALAEVEARFAESEPSAPPEPFRGKVKLAKSL